MLWRDLVFSVGSLVFIAALVPTLRATSKPPRSTGLLTGGVLAIYAATYLTMALWYAAATTAILACAWLGVAVQRRDQEIK